MVQKHPLLSALSCLAWDENFYQAENTFQHLLRVGKLNSSTFLLRFMLLLIPLELNPFVPRCHTLNSGILRKRRYLYLFMSTLIQLGSC